MALVGFCGSRSLPASSGALVSRVVGSVLRSGRSVAVGCAPGADALVRCAAPYASVFQASSFGVGRFSFARRSAALVSAVSSSGPGAGFVGFVSSPCPPGVFPSPLPSRCFSGAGSGSWASLALAVGLGLPVPSSFTRLASRPRLSPPRGVAPGFPSSAPGRAASASSPPRPCRTRSFPDA